MNKDIINQSFVVSNKEIDDKRKALLKQTSQLTVQVNNQMCLIRKHVTE